MVDAVLEKQTGAEDVVWDLSIFYSGAEDPAIDADLAAVHAMADTFQARYKGRVAALTAEELATAVEEQLALEDKSGRVGSFAALLYSTDSANPQYGALMAKVQEHNAALGQKLVFFDLEWNNADDGHVEELLAHPALAHAAHALQSERRYKPYQLTEPEEQILMDKSVTGRSAWTRFHNQLMSSLRYDLNGEKVNQSRILSKLYEPDRPARERAANEITRVLRENAMQTTYVFNTLAADKASDDKRRTYDSWVHSRNLANKTTQGTVDALVSAVTGSYDLVARHYKIKQALLGYDALYDYDRYAPLPFHSDRQYSWDEARATVVKAFYAFHERAGQIAERFFDEHWIHAAVLPNKRGGAYCSSTVPSAHPFVFMNYLGRARDIMTLAHELGHGLHGYLAAEKQGLLYMYTPLTTAEMASTFCEMLVFEDVTTRETDKTALLATLAEKIEDSFATIYRQIAMNRFEDAMHTARRTEGELSTDRLSALWMETQRAMFGDSVNLRDEYAIWWSYIPHFLSTPGYVYAYSFGELLVLALFNLYKQQGAAFAPKYLDVLAAGNSDWPDQLLGRVGVDLTDPNFWQQGIAALRTLVDQEEALAKELMPERF